jgi:hypothetical protein
MKTLIICLILLISCTKQSNEHICPFELCPYKGYLVFPGVINTGETIVDKEQEGSDTYCIDKLHFEFPNASYDELEDLLFKHK